MERGRLPLMAALGAALLWAVLRKPVRIPPPLLQWWSGGVCSLEREAIGWSSRFLHSMGAIESGPRAGQEALTAHKVVCALAERLGAEGSDLHVMIIGGVIHLHGQVSSPEKRTLSEDVAKEVSGAKVIADDLQVVS